MPKISIIVPTYNVEAYLRETVESLINQTMQDIEIILVDNCSTDNSRKIIAEYVEKDKRVISIYNDKDYSLMMSRKKGVLKSKGEYIMFLDGDDTYSLDSCEILYERIQNANVDMLQFNTVIVVSDEIDEDTKAGLRTSLAPYDGILKDSNLLKDCYIDKKISFVMWNKIYRRDLLKHVYEDLPDGYFNLAEDMLTSFLIFYYADSYAGARDLNLYNYYYGRGITGQDQLVLSSFMSHIHQYEIVSILKTFSEKKGIYEKYKFIFDSMKHELIRECIFTWHEKLEKESREQAFNLIIKSFGTSLTVGGLQDLYGEEPGKIAAIMNTFDFSDSGCHDSKKICIIDEGVSEQSELLSLEEKNWLKNGFKISNISLNNVECDSKNLYERLEKIEQLLLKHKNSLVIYRAWTSHYLFWDMLLIKSMGSKFLIHTQNIFSAPLFNGEPYYTKMPQIYSLADAIIVLSRVDKIYWDNFCENVFLTSPYVPKSYHDIKVSSLKNQVVIWDNEYIEGNYYKDLIEIIKLTAVQFPKVIFKIFFRKKGSKSEDRLLELISDEAIDGNVELYDYNENREDHYKDAAVSLMIRNYDVFPLELIESKSYAIPIVNYSLSYSEIQRDSAGMISVDRRDHQNAAINIIRLLDDYSLRKKIGDEGKKSIDILFDSSLYNIWSNVIKSIYKTSDVFENSKIKNQDNESNKIMWDTILEHSKVSFNRIDANNRKLINLKQKKKKLKKSKSLKLGLAITAIPRKLKREPVKIIDNLLR